MNPSVMITGANRGIGLEFTRQYLRDDWTVIGTSRDPDDSPDLQELAKQHPDRLTIPKVDVRKPGQVKGARDRVNRNLDGLDLLINNAGVLGSKADFEKLDEADFLADFKVNCLGSFRVTKTFLPLLREARGNVVFITSLMSSLDDNRSGGNYPYRVSKTALNMLGRSFAVDFESEGIHALLMNPGWVKTDLGNPGAKIEVEESVSGMRSVIEQLDGEMSGSFLNFRGETEPW